MNASMEFAFSDCLELVNIHKVKVRYPRFSGLLELIYECHQVSKIADEPQCLALEGQTGGGKSTLGKTYVSFYPRVEMGTYMRVPVFYLLTPKPATILAVLEAMLAALGDPGAEVGTPYGKRRRLLKLLKECQVELIILDDFQHLVDSDTDYVLKTVSDWLKSLIKEANLPFVVVGMPGKVGRVLNTNPQLSRLFARRETLDSFKWDGQNQDWVDELSRFVDEVEKAVDIRLVSGMARLEFLARLHYASDGTVGHMMNLMRGAVLDSYMHGLSVREIEVVSFARAFDVRLQEVFAKKTNPFLEGDTPFVIPAPKPTPDPVESVSRRGKRGSKDVAASEVLKT